MTRRDFLQRTVGIAATARLATVPLRPGLVFHQDAFVLTMRDLTEEDVQLMEDWAAEDPEVRDRCVLGVPGCRCRDAVVDWGRTPHLCCRVTA